MTRSLAPAIALTLGLASPLSAQNGGRALADALPASAQIALEDTAPMIGLAVPIAPAIEGDVETARATGALTRTVWQVPGPLATVDQLAEPLRARLVAEGATILLDCTARACGGFAFRYATDTAPGPEMHVDLGDYRFISARKGVGTDALWTTVMVSRSATTGFFQITRISPTRPPAPTGAHAGRNPVQNTDAPLADSLTRDGRAILDGLAFETGASALGPGPFPALEALSDLLRGRPDLDIILVGHTDAEGALDSNIDLSRRRAEAVRARLISEHAIEPARLRAEGVGYLTPVAPNDTPEGRATNRRVEVIVDPG
jgi:OOP family OmpA-OmpF porin